MVDDIEMARPKGLLILFTSFKLLDILPDAEFRHVVNAGLDYKPRENLTLSMRVFNLLDAVYVNASKSTTAWYLGAPRSVQASLRYTF